MQKTAGTLVEAIKKHFWNGPERHETPCPPPPQSACQSCARKALWLEELKPFPHPCVADRQRAEIEAEEIRQEELNAELDRLNSAAAEWLEQASPEKFGKPN